MSHLQLVSSIQNVKGVLRISSKALGDARGKRHDNVLQVIDALIAADPTLARLNFQASSYLDSTGRSCKQYLCTEKGALLVGMNLGTRKQSIEFQGNLIDAFLAARSKLASLAVPPPTQMAFLEGMFNQLKETDGIAREAREISREALSVAKSTAVKAAVARPVNYLPLDLSATITALVEAAHTLKPWARGFVLSVGGQMASQGFLSFKQARKVREIAVSTGVAVYRGDA